MMYIVYYTKTGDLYLVLGETEFKHPETREWIKAVQYRPLYGDINKTYVREITEFNERFKHYDGPELKVRQGDCQ